MKLHLPSFAILCVFTFGCGKSENSTTSTPLNPSGLNPKNPVALDPSIPGPSVNKTPTSGVPAGNISLDQLLAEAPPVDLVPHEFKLGKIEFTIQAPKGAITTQEGNIYFPNGSGIEINVAHNLAAAREWWLGKGMYKAKQFLVDTPDTVFTEATESRNDRYHFDAVVTTSHLDLSIRNTKKNDIGAVIDTKGNCILLLKCARTITTKKPAPADPVAALESLGASVLKDEAGKVVEVRFLSEGACTRSTVALLPKLSDIKRVNFAFSAVEGTDLTPLKELKNLEDLSFHSTFVQDSGIEIISALKHLKRLSIIWGQITTKGVAPLRSLTELTHLTLERNDLSDLGPEPLAGMTKMEHLSLENSKASDAVLQAVKNMPNLKSLNLGYASKVSDAGLPNLYGLKQLADISLIGTEVTPSGVEKLKAALPKAKIRHKN